jgi:hypothetical protein
MTKGAHMRLSALRVGSGFFALTLLLAACSSSGSGKSKSDGGGTEAGQVGDAADSGRDVAPAATDTRDLGGTGEVSTQLPPVDAAGEGAAPDVPMTTASEAGSPGAEVGNPGATEAGGSEAPNTSPDGGLLCGAAGAICKTAADCCGLACISGTCADVACLSDGAACITGGECCSTVCGTNGTCVPLNTSCKTAGNTCAADGDCCSKVCNASKQCAPPSAISYCAQAGDICAADIDCCTGICNLAAGATVGTCGSISTSCLIDGTVCNGCGSCCSHFCGPFGVGGPSICQPASGCHVQGDLCRSNSDCCGGDSTSGLPGAGLVQCEPDPVYGARVGTCGGPRASNCPGGIDTCKNSCNPEGNVCHYQDTAICQGAVTSKRNDCCACIAGKDCCQLDRAGIPRCNALAACVPVGEACAFADECCNHAPCLPDPATGKLTCGSSCARIGEACTTNGDCCTGMLCDVTPGSLAGTCMVPPPPPGQDAGEPDAGGPDAGEPDTAPPVCAFFGQTCSTAVPCCTGSTCVNADFVDCTAADVDCVCFTPE